MRVDLENWTTGELENWRILIENKGGTDKGITVVEIKVHGEGRLKANICHSLSQCQSNSCQSHSAPSPSLVCM